MNITYYGHSCFKIVSNNLVIVTDPFDKNIGLRPPKVQAEIVTISHNHHDHNNISAISGQPFIVSSPGEYEIKGVSIFGILSFHDPKEGEERGLNTIYLIEAEGIKICHLGDFGQSQFSDQQLEAINQVDILFIPVGGKYTINASLASSLVSQIEPKIVIPMHYQLPGLKIDLDPINKFLKEMGLSKKESVDKLTIKKKNLPSETEVVIMRV